MPIPHMTIAVHACLGGVAVSGPLVRSWSPQCKRDKKHVFKKVLLIPVPRIASVNINNVIYVGAAVIDRCKKSYFPGGGTECLSSIRVVGRST